MPLLHLNQVNDAPLPVSVQADASSLKQWTHKNNGPNGNGGEFTITQLLEDIAVPIATRNVDTTGLNIVDAATTKAINALKDQTVLKIKTEAKYQGNRDQWMIYWNEAFQRDPSVDLSQKINDEILKLIDPTSTPPGAYSDFLTIMKNSGIDGLADNLVKAIDEVMKALPASVTDKSIDYADVETTMNNEIDDVLKNFNMNLADDGKRPEVLAIKDLENKAEDALDRGFEATEQIRADRPYRKDWDQAKAEQTIKDEFKKLYSTTEWVNRLAAEALSKAKDELAGILKDATPDNLDTRTLGVIMKFNEWTHKQPNPQPKTPPELFNSLLGDATGGKFIDWITKWGSLLVISHNEKVSGQDVTINIGVKLRDGVAPISASPAMKIDYQTLDAIGKKIVEEQIPTPTMTIKESSYSTDELLQSYKNAIALITTASSISEDNFKAFLKTLPTALDPSAVTNGQTWSGISLADMEALNPEVFKDFADKVDDAKKKAEAEYYATSASPKWTSALDITFDIKANKDKNGDIKLTITPHIVDPNIGKISPIKWSSTIPTEQAASDATKSVIERMFADSDNLHEEITPTNAMTVVEKVVAPLYAKATEVYDALKFPQKAPYPFVAEYNGKIEDGEVVTLKFMEDNFPTAAKALSYFDDVSSRFKIKFTISKHSDEDREMSVTYIITDSTIADTSDEFYSISKSPEDKKPLEVDGIKFNQADNKAETWLGKLAESEKGKYETTDDLNFDNRQYVDDIGKRSPLEMTPAEFDAVFKEFKTIAGDALKTDQVTITKDDIKYDSNEERWLQGFVASYLAGTGKTVTTKILWLPFTERFLHPDDITKVRDEIDDKAKEATETIDKSKMTDQEKSDFLAQMSAEQSALHDQIDSLNKNPLEPDMHEGQAQELKTAAEEFNDKAKEAIRDSLLKKVKGKIIDHFGDLSKVPPKILELLAKYPDSMMKIVENNPGLLDNIPELTKLLEKYGDSLDPNAIMSAQKTLQQSGKWFLLSLGSILGLGAGLGVANSVKVATTNKKSVSSTGKIKSSKKLAIISALIGLASAAGSVATLVYLFVAQGGL